MKGGAILDLPTQKVRKAFIQNVESILQNRNPSYDDVAELTNDEKKLLYKLTKMANLQDKIKVPHPCDLDKENHRFELLKGQIMAGQDSKEMIKEFKVLLIKLMNDKRIPKGQATNILTDLISLGY